MSDQVKGFVRVAVSDERLPFIYNICSWLASLSNTEQRPRNSITGGESHGLGLAQSSAPACAAETTRGSCCFSREEDGPSVLCALPPLVSVCL